MAGKRSGKAVGGLAVTALVLGLATAWPVAADPASDAARLDRILTQTPLIDGHNDLPWELRGRFADKAAAVDLQHGAGALMTALPRLHKGRVGGQFWSVFIPVEIQGPLAVQVTIEQIDLVKSLAKRYPADLEMAYTAADVARIHQKAGRVASLIGIEGGHQIDEHRCRPCAEDVRARRALHDADPHQKHRLGGLGHRPARPPWPDALWP